MFPPSPPQAYTVVALLSSLTPQNGFEVDVRELATGYSPRSGELDRAHVVRLTETGGDWPPLLVHRSTFAVIDGAHRLAAAKSLGMTTVPILLFEGTEEEARIEAIRCNNSHGLPLTLADRKRAASYLIGQDPDWSNGRVAEICAISPKTVAALRPAVGVPDGLGVDPPRPSSRLGRDGKRHPVDLTITRARVIEALVRSPRASLRLLAAEAGVSPETVRAVRRSLGEIEAPSPRADSQLPTIDLDLLAARPDMKSWSADTALASTAEGARFAAWFDGHEVCDTALWEHPVAVPTSRLYEVIDEARRRSRFWAQFAERLEARVPVHRQ